MRQYQEEVAGEEEARDIRPHGIPTPSRKIDLMGSGAAWPLKGRGAMRKYINDVIREYEIVYKTKLNKWERELVEHGYTQRGLGMDKTDVLCRYGSVGQRRFTDSEKDLVEYGYIQKESDMAMNYNKYSSIERPKYFLIYAGVNGAGKTTLREYNERDGIRVSRSLMGTDGIARTINYGEWASEGVQAEAKYDLNRWIKNDMDSKISSGLETTLADKSILDTIQKAKEKGYIVRMYYVGVSDLKTAQERIQEAKPNMCEISHVFTDKGWVGLCGTYEMPGQLLEKRYKESLSNLITAIRYCDCVEIYDNSTSLTRVGAGADGMLFGEEPCQWFEPILQGYWKESINRVRQDLIISGHQPAPEVVDSIVTLNERIMKEHTLKDIKILYGRRKGYRPEIRKQIEETVACIKNNEMKNQKGNLISRFAKMARGPEI